jgi:hypothetical protein
MWYGDFHEFFSVGGIAEFFVEAEGGLAGVHAEAFVAQVAGDVLCEDHEGAAYSLALHAVRYGHLAKAYGRGVHPGEEAAAQEAFIFEGAHEDIFFFFIQFSLFKGQSEWFTQYLIAQTDHLPIFLRSMIYHPKGHAVINLIAPGEAGVKMGLFKPFQSREAEVI